MADKTLKLYVWENVLRDYTDGIAFALAPNEIEARELVIEKLESNHEDLCKRPRVIEEPEGFYLWGGG